MNDTDPTRIPDPAEAADPEPHDARESKPHRPKRKGTDKRAKGINIYIYPNDLRLLDALCRAHDLSRAAVIAQLIRKNT